MLELVNAILPVFIVVVTGAFLHRYIITSQTFWNEADRLIFYVLLPLMLIRALSRAPVDAGALAPGAVVVLVTAILGFLILIPQHISPMRGSDFTSLFQGVVRVNFYIALSIAGVLYGTAGIEQLSLMLVFLIPASVLSTLLIFHIYSEHETPGFWRMIGYNPIIIATFIGLGLNVVTAGTGLPPFADTTLKTLGRASLPMALLGIGAALRPAGITAHAGILIWAIVLRLVIGPAIGFVLCLAFGVGQIGTMGCVLILGVPSAASGITFASRMGGNRMLMSSILTIQTLASFLTLWVLIYAVKVSVPT